MSHDSGEVPGQAPAGSSEAQPSARPTSPEPADTSSPVEPDENSQENDQKQDPGELPDDKKDVIHGASDADISTAYDNEGDDAFNRLSRLLQDGEEGEDNDEVIGTIDEMGKKWPEQLDRAFEFDSDDGVTGVTALHMAVYKKLPKTFDALIEGRKSLSKATNGCCQIPLHIACAKERLDFVEKLVKLKSNINAQDKWLLTPLHYACSHGYFETVKFLLGCKADITLTDEDGWTPFTTAAVNGYENIVQELLPISDIDHPDKNQSTPLDLACWNGRDSIVRLLTEKDLGDRVNIESRDNSGWTPLITASRAGYPKVVELLLKVDAELTARTSDEDGGWTALMTACCRGHKETVTMLLKHPGQADAILNQTDNDGDTPLHYATQFGQWDIVDTLLERNSPHSKRNKDGYTPLHMACLVYLEDVAAGDDGESRTENCKTVSQSSATDETTDPFLRILKSLLKQGADPSVKTNEDDTALHIVARGRSSMWIEDIMEKLKPEVYSQKNKADKTPLHIAVERVDSSVILALMKKLGSPEYKFRDLENDAYEMMLKKFNSKEESAFNIVDIEDIPKILLAFFSAMAPPDVRERRTDWGALEWAAVEGHPRVLWGLLAKTNQTRNRIGRALRELEKLEDSHRAEPSKKGERSDGRDRKTLKGGKKTAEGDVAAGGKSIEKQKHAEKSRKPRDGKENDARESDRKLIKDILKNPPITTTSMPREKLLPPEKPKDFRIPRQMEVELLEFFVSRKASGFLRRSESVEGVIYTKGPQKIMTDLKKVLRKRKEEEVGPPVEDLQEEFLSTQVEPKFTWIHLPANNIKWMKDLTKRIWSEEAKAKAGNPRASEKGAEGSKDKAPEATGDGSEPKVEPGKHNESRCPPNDGDQQNRHDDSRNPSDVEDHDSLEDKFNTAKWFFKTSWRELPENLFEKKFMRPVCKEDNSVDVRVQRLEKGTGHSDPPGDLVALYMPYLRFATESDPEDTHAIGEKGENLYQLRSHHKDFLQSYTKDTVHGSRTLDEFYYQHLVAEVKESEQVRNSREDRQDRFKNDLKERNRHQVASRYFHGDDHEREQLDHWDILRVDQLWMWIINEKTIVTSSTHSFDGAKDPVLDGVLGFLSERTQDPRGYAQAADTDIQKFSRVVVQVCCDFYNEAWRDSTETTESVRHIFSNTINDIAIKETKLFQQYRRRAENGDGSNTTVDPKVAECDNGAKRDMATKRWHKRQNKTEEDRQKLQNGTKGNREKRQKSLKEGIADAAKLFYEIKDTSDELKILLNLATHQKNVQAKLCEKDGKDECKAENIVEDLKEKLELASKIRQAVETTLTLQQAELSYEQGKTLMAFTIVTILFLPASFCSSLFALDVASFLESPLWAFLVLGAAFIAMIVFSALLYRATLAEWLKAWANGLLEPGREVSRRLSKIFLPEGQEKESSSKEKHGTTENKPGGNSGGNTKPPVEKTFSPEGQEKEPSLKEKDGTAGNKAGGSSGGEAKPPVDDRREAPGADAEGSKGKEPVQTMKRVLNGANGHTVEKVEPRWRSWLKKLLRGVHTTDRGPEVDV